MSVWAEETGLSNEFIGTQEGGTPHRGDPG